MLMHQTVLCEDVVVGWCVKNTSLDRQVILHLSVKPSREASSALWDKAAALLGP